MNHTSTKDFLNRVLNIELVDFIRSLGMAELHQEKGISFFPSPFPGKRTALQVDQRLNVFHDENAKISNGNIIDFGLRYYQVGIPGFLSFVKKNYPFKNQEPRHPDQIAMEKTNYKDDIKLLNHDQALSRMPYRTELRMRKIPPALAVGLVEGVRFLYRNEQQYALAFKNNSGGYELSRDFIRHHIGPQDITTIDLKGAKLDVFSNFEDLLAHRALYATVLSGKDINMALTPEYQQALSGLNNILVLNQEYHFEKARPYMEQHEQVNLYLNHSKNNTEFIGYSQWLDPLKYKDFSAMYKHEKSLSTYQVNRKKDRKKNHNKKL